jgi:hypothetical protein
MQENIKLTAEKSYEREYSTETQTYTTEDLGCGQWENEQL